MKSKNNNLDNNFNINDNNKKIIELFKRFIS